MNVLEAPASNRSFHRGTADEIEGKIHTGFPQSPPGKGFSPSVLDCVLL